MRVVEVVCGWRCKRESEWKGLLGVVLEGRVAAGKGPKGDQKRARIIREGQKEEGRGVYARGRRRKGRGKNKYKELKAA